MRLERALLFCSMGWPFPLLTLGGAPLFGCVNASDQVQGGDPLFVGTGSLTGGDGGFVNDGGGGFLDAASACQPGGAHGGHSWTDLYACYFGPTGVVTCESQSNCHGAPNQQGAIASAYVCAPTQSDCYQGMLKGGLVSAGSPSDPTQSLLYVILCKDPSAGMGMGQMPYQCPPSTWLLPGDLARIGAWIKEGAPND